jgi:hypothetical protein
MCETPNYSATTPDQDCFNRLRRHKIIFSIPRIAVRAAREGICRPITRRRSARKLREAQTEMATHNNADPWRLRLERVRGRVGDDGLERVSTQTLFDHLEVPQRSRRAGACRRLAQVMRELAWTPVRVRDLTRGGYKEQVRGYCRNARHLARTHN